jgi:steroid delta-isomerase-like uncharacterized protein
MMSGLEEGRTGMSVETNRCVITRYFEEVWNLGKLDVLDELLTSDYVNHSPGFPNPAPGPVGLKPIVAHMRTGLADLRYEILECAIENDVAAVYVRCTGKHVAELFGMPATGRSIDIRQMQFERFRQGRICAHWRITDELTMLRQLKGES